MYIYILYAWSLADPHCRNSQKMHPSLVIKLMFMAPERWLFDSWLTLHKLPPHYGHISTHLVQGWVAGGHNMSCQYSDQQRFLQKVDCWVNKVIAIERGPITYVLWIVLREILWHPCFNFIFLEEDKRRNHLGLSLRMDLYPNVGIPADPAANEYRLRHVGRIPYSAFQVSSTILMQ